MTGNFDPGGTGPSPFDEFMARFFSTGDQRPSHRVDITRLMTQQAQEMLANAVRLAADRHTPDLDATHLLWAATQNSSTRSMLESTGASPESLAESVERQIPSSTNGAAKPPTLTPAAKRALLDAHHAARTVGASYISPEHLLLALAANTESGAGSTLLSHGVNIDALKKSIKRQQQSGKPPMAATPTLDQYGQDLTAKAREGDLDPVIGRDEEIEQTIEILARRTKNNPVLVGEAGVGKTAIVEGIAERIIENQVPQVLMGKRVIQLDLSGLIAGTRYRGDFEERMNKLLNEISEHQDELVVFIDELHTVVGAGGTEGAMDAGNMLKPRLARGELHVVGATTLDEYREKIEQDAALERRFQPVLVSEPSVEDTIKILCGLRDRYEAHHQVRFTDEAIAAAAELSDRYLTDRNLPDKAIDLIDQAGARKRTRSTIPTTGVRQLEEQIEQLRLDKEQAANVEDYERASKLRDEINELQQQIDQQRGVAAEIAEVSSNDIAEVVSRATGIPATQLTEEEKTRLARLEEQLEHRVLGQDEAVHAVARAVRRSRSGLADPGRPVGSFLFLGPTGVGKTELAKALAEALFGDEDRMIRLDMSEFQEAHTASRLVGSPPGYVGYDKAGQFTEQVRRKPYSVILLDEVEKAHPDVFNVLLQVLEDGRLTDSQGRTVSFRNTVLILTSNLGSDIVSQRSGILGFSSRDQEQAEGPAREKIMDRLRESFRPEFLNRIDEIVVFRKLDSGQLAQITELLLDNTRRRLRAQGIEVEFSRSAVDWLAEHGYQPEFGARPLRRTIQREVDDPISDMLLSGELHSGQELQVSAADGELSFSMRPARGDQAS